MTDASIASPTLTIAILSSQCLVWLGLQKILESSTTVRMVVRLYPGRTSDLLRAERRPDLFILDLETECDAIGTITQIRESPRPVRSCCCAGLRTRTARTRRLPAASTASSSKFSRPPLCSR